MRGHSFSLWNVFSYICKHVATTEGCRFALFREGASRCMHASVDITMVYKVHTHSGAHAFQWSYPIDPLPSPLSPPLLPTLCSDAGLEGYARVMLLSVGHNATLKFTCYPQRAFFNAAFDSRPQDESARAPPATVTVVCAREYLWPAGPHERACLHLHVLLDENARAARLQHYLVRLRGPFALACATCRKCARRPPL